MRKEYNSSLLPGDVQTIKQNSPFGSIEHVHSCRHFFGSFYCGICVHLKDTSTGTSLSHL